MKKWEHPGGKLIEEGSASLTDSELLAILISTGIKDKPAKKIADEILVRYGSLDGLFNQPLEDLLQIKGLGDTKIIRIAAAYELALRLRKESEYQLHEETSKTDRKKGKGSERTQAGLGKSDPEISG